MDSPDANTLTLAPARRTSRRRLLQRSAVVGTGLAVVGLSARAGYPLAGVAQATALDAACGESIEAIMSTLLTAEQIAMALYYTALTSAAVVGHPYLAGASADPNHVASNGSRVNVGCMQAALDQERKHAAILVANGGSSAHTAFYFPLTTFAALGYTSLPTTFLGVLDHLETAMIGVYLAAVARFATLGRADLALLATRMLGPECQHRAIGRVIAGDTPANNMALQVNSFACATGAVPIFNRYLTGEGFSGGSTAAIHLPSNEEMTRVIGKNASS